MFILHSSRSGQNQAWLTSARVLCWGNHRVRIWGPSVNLRAARVCILQQEAGWYRPSCTFCSASGDASACPSLRALLSCRDASSNIVQDLPLIISATSDHNGCAVRVMARALPHEANALFLHWWRQCVWASWKCISTSKTSLWPECGPSFPPYKGQDVLQKAILTSVLFLLLFLPRNFIISSFIFI